MYTVGDKANKLMIMLKPAARIKTGLSGSRAKANSEGGVWGFMQQPQWTGNRE
jgi:hypothetical protein